VGAASAANVEQRCRVTGTAVAGSVFQLGDPGLTTNDAMEIDMNEKLEAGLTRTARISVDDARTISFMGDEGRVYATPELVRDIEMTCRDLLLGVIDAGQDSVGTHIDVSHIAATPVGTWAEIDVTVTAVDGRAVTFDISARDPLEQICHGKHSRFVVDVAKTIARLKGKVEAVAAA